MYILIRNCVSTHVIALFVYENVHVCITITPLGNSFGIALYIRQVLIFGWREVMTLMCLSMISVSYCNLFHMALTQVHGIFSHMI